MEGDKSRAICEHCEALVETTFARRNVPFSDGQGVAESILVAVCDTCGQVASIPAQSTPAIKAARDAAVVSIEARLPASYLERLDQAMHTITTAAATKHRKMFLSLYIDYLYRNDRWKKEAIFTWSQYYRIKIGATASVKNAEYYSAFPGITRQEESKRLSLKLNFHIAGELTALQEQTKLSQTDLLKNVICQMQDDIVNRPNQELINELTLFARAAV